MKFPLPHQGRRAAGPPAPRAAPPPTGDPPPPARPAPAGGVGAGRVVVGQAGAVRQPAAGGPTPPPAGAPPPGPPPGRGGPTESCTRRGGWQRQTAGGETHRIRGVIDRVADVEYTLTDSVSEALLLLEANLIKRHRPRFLESGRSA